MNDGFYCDFDEDYLCCECGLCLNDEEEY